MINFWQIIVFIYLFVHILIMYDMYSSCRYLIYEFLFMCLFICWIVYRGYPKFLVVCVCCFVLFNRYWGINERSRGFFTSEPREHVPTIENHRRTWVPPKNGVIALWPNTRGVKCKYYVSQKQNPFNNKFYWYSILLTFKYKFTARLHWTKIYVLSNLSNCRFTTWQY